MTRAQILRIAATPSGLLDAPKAWSVSTLATVMQLEGEGELRLETVEFYAGVGRSIRVKAWFATNPVRKPCAAFTDEEAGR